MIMNEAQVPVSESQSDKGWYNLIPTQARKMAQKNIRCLANLPKEKYETLISEKQERAFMSKKKNEKKSASPRQIIMASAVAGALFGVTLVQKLIPGADASVNMTLGGVGGGFLLGIAGSFLYLRMKK